jgi:phosphoribosyl 1,2-cyclic phosphodiesterase
MRVRPIASSSAANATLLESEGRTLLLDAGVPYRELQRATGHRLASLDGVLLTHEHGDPARAARDLLARALAKIVATRGTLEALGIDADPRAAAIEPLVSRELLGYWKILAFPVVHDAREPVGFVVSSPTGKALYLTDAAFTRYRFVGITHALVEANHEPALVDAAVRAGATDAKLASRIRANHLSLQGALRVLDRIRGRSLEEVWLLHLSDGHSDARRFREVVELETGVPTYVAGHQGSLA